MAKKNSIKSELAKIVRKRVASPYLELLGIVDGAVKTPNILQAIALAQVKKGLEGDLKAAEFIEELLADGEEEMSDTPFGVEIKVVGDSNEA